MEVPLYRLFYDGENPHKAGDLQKYQSEDDAALGQSGKESRVLNQFRKLLPQANESDRELLLFMAQKMASKVKRPMGAE